MTSTDLAIVESTEVSVRDQAQAAITRLETATPDEALIIADDVDVLLDLLKRRGWALSELNELAEVKIKAERKIGEARISLIRDVIEEFDWKRAKEMLDAGEPLKAVARALGVAPNTIRYYRSKNFERAAIGGRGAKAHKSSALRTFDARLNLLPQRVSEFTKLAALPDEQLDEIINEIKSNGNEITTNRVLRDARLRAWVSVERVESNIYRMGDGRFQIRFQSNGRRISRTLNTTELTTARKALLEAKGVLSTRTTTRAVARVDASMSDLRIALDRLDKTLHTLAPEARKAADEAISHGHRMEDALTRCLKSI